MAIVRPQVELPDLEYRVFTIDLTVAHTDEPLGLAAAGVVARNLDIHLAESAFSIKLNKVDADVIACEKGLNISNFRMTEIYYSNEAATGEGKIFVSWR